MGSELSNVESSSALIFVGPLVGKYFMTARTSLSIIQIKKLIALV